VRQLAWAWRHVDDLSAAAQLDDIRRQHLAGVAAGADIPHHWKAADELQSILRAFHRPWEDAAGDARKAIPALTSRWESVWGRMSDPAVQAKVHATAAAIMSRGKDARRGRGRHGGRTALQ
jgi:hypothetical protein